MFFNDLLNDCIMEVVDSV